MLYNILAVGDVVGGCGISHLERHLRAVKKMKNIHFTVVNGENAAMVGLTPGDAERIFAAGSRRHHAREPQLRQGADLGLSRRLPVYPAPAQPRRADAGAGIRRLRLRAGRASR